MAEQTKNEMIYLAAYAVLKRLHGRGVIEKSVFERLNQKNAETQGCKLIAI